MPAVCRYNGFCTHEQRTGKKCMFAHPAGVKQTLSKREHNKYTQMCLNFQVGQCDNLNCNYAHSEEQCVAANEALGRDCREHLAWFWEEVKASEDLADKMYEELSCIEPSEDEQSFLDVCIDEQDAQETMEVNPELVALARGDVQEEVDAYWVKMMDLARQMAMPPAEKMWGDDVY